MVLRNTAIDRRELFRSARLSTVLLESLFSFETKSFPVLTRGNFAESTAMTIFSFGILT
jgi:hypothetical protein